MLPALALAALATSTASNFQSILDERRSAQQVPGISVVVTRGDRVVFAGASGLADIESKRAMTPDTLLYAGSLSKLLTAVLTLRLAEENKLALDGVVAERGLDLGRSPDITVAHLLTHASGLKREGNFNYWFTADFPDTNALTRYLAGAELRAQPGAELHYSSVGYAALGLVIERTTGQTYADALRTRVSEPLAMASTGVPGPPPGIATGYTPVGRVIPNENRPFAGVGRAVGGRHVREYHNARAMSPAFGAYTSARDLGRLARFLLGHGGDDVLSPAMRERMRTRQASGWGLGLKVGRYAGRPVARHEGWFAAHRSHLLLDAGDDIGIVVLTNSDSGAPAIIAEALFAAMIQPD
jgi:CubicO group peptidase (beta-lactamase class C family)